ncbi:hypothetical protein T484DRAFT_1919951 [Baffinella frigidus]|nr:hypothetical protein T484DRAFT_1919951 [Cryptophyta sp. CCMP2293]
MTDVRDSAVAIVDLLLLGTPGEVYNICSGQATPVRKIIELLLEKSTVVGIALEEDPTRLRTFDEKVLLGDNFKLVAVRYGVDAPRGQCGTGGVDQHGEPCAAS